MSDQDPINRRMFLGLLSGASLALLLPSSAWAKDGEDDGSDSSDSGSGGSDNDSSDSGDSGGEDNGGDSGGDSGNDDGGEDDSGGGTSGSGGDSSGSSGSGKSGSGKRDQDKVKDAVLKGDVIPLAEALALLKSKYTGRVIEILYAAKGSKIDYRFKLLDDSGKVISVTMDARTGRLRGFFGF